MTALDHVRRKRTTVMLAASLAMLMLFVGFAYAGYKALRRYEGAKKVDDLSQPIPATPVGLLATVDDNNVLTSMTLLVLKPYGEGGGSAVSVPVSIDSSLGYGDERLPFTEVYAAGGIEELKSTVENSMAITLDVWQALPPAEAAELLAPLAQIPVDLPLAVGTIAAGPSTLSPAQAVEVLNARVEGQRDRERRPNVAAVWSGIAGAATTAAPLAPVPTAPVDDGASTTVATVPSTVAELFASLISGPVNSRELAADVMSAELNPAGKDVEQLLITDSMMVLATIAPRSMSTPAAGLSYLIQTPPGYEDRVQVMIAGVLFTGGNVKWIKFDGPALETTRFLFKQDSIRQQAESSGITTSYTDGQFGVPETAFEDIDVIIQLGADFLLATGTPDFTTTTIAGQVPVSSTPSASTLPTSVPGTTG